MSSENPLSDSTTQQVGEHDTGAGPNFVAEETAQAVRELKAAGFEVAVEGPPAESREAGEFDSGQNEIYTPVSEEQIQLEKQRLVTKEVKLSQSPIEEPGRVSGRVRRERFRIEPEEGVGKNPVKKIHDPHEE